MPQNKICLVISQSGRALAASARMAGLSVHVLDGYADLDTVAATASCQAVPGDANGLLPAELLDRLAAFRGRPLLGVLYGSGLEAGYEVLAFLGRHFSLLGNDAAVVRMCKEPASFFPMLARLGIPCPETCFSPPVTNPAGADWIMKRTGASGGGHIRSWNTDLVISVDAGYYFQKKISGRCFSVVFLADTRDAIIIGFNTIWPVAPEKNDFRYLGARTEFNLPDKMTRDLTDITHTLVRELQLKGLCGLDVIMDEQGQCYVLEINPRPTATFELHQAQQSLCEAHILACQGHLAAPVSAPAALRAHQVIYADREFVMPEITWPEWASDRPHPGRLIRVNDPVCTIHATAVTVNDINTLLHNRMAALTRLMRMRKLAA